MSKPDALQRSLQLILRDRQRRGWQLEPPAPGTLTGMVDFGSNDTLSLSSSGLLRKEFLKELGKYPDFILGGRASRWGEGSTDYFVQLEEHIAKFHKADSALFFNTGFEANVAIFSTLPQPHDVVLYDSLVHASTREGLYRGRANTLPFAHNDMSSLRQGLETIKCRMDGDVAPLQAIVKEGSGLVSHLGLEKDFSIRVHTFGKAHGASGAVVLASQVCKQTLLSCVRGLIFSTAPTFTTLAAIKAGYSILASIEGKRRRELVQSNINSFYNAVSSHAAWPSCQNAGIITIPMKPAYDTLKSPIIPVIAPYGGAAFLGQFLSNAKFRVLVVHFPVVPKDKERVRINLHADHTPDQILSLVDLILEWTQSRRKVGIPLSHL
ncbi:serine palmitoyltransferase Lcb2 subunit [Fusarium denticulatum]|uniref:Serine palmitoyltransferase Lcb2 subunit n=1 Tax=Fusarium denticulatum TaxID=48507 RepID=A0A8H5X7F5_9HYPO|nr:serine palmitoyltransferase Lcb2 subunit [Fusarium denticulatum]